MKDTKSQFPNSKQIIIIFFLVGLILGGCQSRQTERLPEKETIPVKVAKVKLEDIQEVLEYTGDIKAEEEAIIYPKVSGKIIEKVKEDGSFIKKGEVIVYIDRDEVGLKFERAPVESPLEGVVGRVYVDIGQNVGVHSPIALIVKMDKVKVNLEIPEKYLSQLHLGLKAKIKVDAYPNEEFLGRISKISPVIELATRTIPVEIMVDNPDYKLKPGMFARVSLILQEYKKVPVVLKEALIGKKPDVFVYVIENKKAFLKKINLGISQGPYYQIKEGLKENDLVVVMGQQRLYEEADVIIEE
ncbi:MAG: efflux RND transporter periplasmic adaptor subunit [Candidatus Omnitrophica bacterium]|nr:efflux RND transporter periplasmic adaptor subunit [Candidatus Omnitrophota bacterium]MCM8800010.1 efflux RND transporter periplasmic adaptor subunit [Candidatus Omnitrophota bacterium]